MDKKYGIFFEITHIQSLLNGVFDSFAEGKGEFSSLGGFSPDVDICESSSELIVTFEVSGVDVNALKLTLLRDRIILEGNKSRSKKNSSDYICMERAFGKFRRMLPLTSAVNTHNAEARLHNGLLVVRIPKLTDRRGKAIIINIEEKK